MSNILIYSHKADVDGIGCVVLAKYAFTNVDYILCQNVYDLEEKFRQDMFNNLFDQYDAIYVTDLALNEPTLTMAYNNISIQKKLTIIDHHQRTIDDKLDKYDFVYVFVKLDERKTCATELFYRYLYMKNFIRYSDASFDFVEHIREEDTWEWDNKTSFGILSHDLSLLLNAIGIECFINSMVEKIKKNEIIKLTENEQAIIDEYKEKIAFELNKYKNEIEFFVDEDGYKYGAIFAPYYLRNEIPELMRKEKKDISYFVSVNLDNTAYGQKSYRIINGNCDLNKIARKYGGGGHKESAHVLITKEQREKLDNFSSQKQKLEYILNESYK